MKRMLFLCITLALFSLFAMSICAVSGAKTDEFGEVTCVSGINENTAIQDKTSRVVLLNSDGTYTTYPAYYISDVNLQWQGTVQYKFDALNQALGTNYSMESIIRLEILADSTVMNQNGGSFQGLKNLKEVAFPKNTQMKELGGQQFKSSGLEKIEIPATVTKIGTLLFEDCRSLKEVTFAQGFSLTSLPNQMFTLCTSLEKITLPDSVESVGAGFFSRCTSLKELRLGKNFKSFGSQCLALCRNDLVIYAPSTLLQDEAEIGMGLFTYDSGNLHQITLFFEGTREQAQALIDKSSHRGLKEASLVEWQGDADSNYIPASPTAWTIVYCYNMCSHKWSESDDVKVTDFYSPISVGKICTKCQAVSTTKTIRPIFECMGNSMTESPDANGKYYMTVGYKIDRAAYEEYKKYGTLDFGFIICFTSVSGNTPLTVSNGKVTAQDSSGVFVASFDGYFNFYDVKIGGISPKLDGQELALCIYTYDGKSIHYLCENGQSNIVKGVSLKL